MFYQEDQSALAVLDFNTSQQYTLNLPIRSKYISLTCHIYISMINGYSCHAIVKQILVVEPNFWLAKGSRDAATYAVYSEDASAIPTIMEPIQALGQNGQYVSDLVNVFWNEFA